MAAAALEKGCVEGENKAARTAAAALENVRIEDERKTAHRPTAAAARAEAERNFSRRGRPCVYSYRSTGGSGTLFLGGTSAEKDRDEQEVAGGRGDAMDYGSRRGRDQPGGGQEA